MNQLKKNLLNFSEETIIFKNNDINIIEELISFSRLWIVDNNYYPMEFDFKNYGLTGYFMSSIIQELYSIYLNSSNQEQITCMINDSIYHDEIDLYNKICGIIGINNQVLLFTSNKDNKARNYMREKFFCLTKDKAFWDKLEQQLDLFIKNRGNLEIRQNCYQNINKILENALEYAVIGGVLDNNSSYLDNKVIKLK